MSDNDFVSKSALIEQIRRVVEKRGSGYFSVLTDNKLSLLIGFTQGRLTRLRCRALQANDVLSVLGNTSHCKYTFSSGQDDETPDIMPVDVFLSSLALGGPATAPAAGGTAPQASQVTRKQLTDLAAEYMGIAAEMVVDEAFEETSSLVHVIESVAGAIPDARQAKAFRLAARELFAVFYL